MCPNHGLISSKLDWRVKSAKPNLLLRGQPNSSSPCDNHANIRVEFYSLQAASFLRPTRVLNLISLLEKGTLRPGDTTQPAHRGPGVEGQEGNTSPGPLPPIRAPYLASLSFAFSISKMGVIIDLPSEITEIMQVTHGIAPGVKCKRSVLATEIQAFLRQSLGAGDMSVQVHPYPPTP